MARSGSSLRKELEFKHCGNTFFGTSWHGTCSDACMVKVRFSVSMLFATQTMKQSSSPPAHRRAHTLVRQNVCSRGSYLLLNLLVKGRCTQTFFRKWKLSTVAAVSESQNSKNVCVDMWFSKNGCKSLTQSSKIEICWATKHCNSLSTVSKVAGTHRWSDGASPIVE